jgi:hypothetical protein
MEEMNLVERMVATNQQSVTSVELAEAAGMTQQELCQFIKVYRDEIASDEPLKKEGNGYVLTVDQTFAAILFLEMSEGEEPIPADQQIAALKRSFIKVFKTRILAEKRACDAQRRAQESFGEWD